MTKRKNLGTVVNVQIIDGFFDQDGQHIRYCRSLKSAIVGYDWDGKPKVEEYEIGMYRVTLRDKNGELGTIEFYGRKPKLGSQLLYPKNRAKKDDSWKEHRAYLQSLLTSPSLADRIRYAGILENSIL